MFCNDAPEEAASQSLPHLNTLNNVTNLTNLNNLDSALHELGMLSTITDSRNQYLQEMRRKSFGSKPSDHINKALKAIKNFQYMSNVAIGLRMKRASNHRTMPYTVPERNRTKSENSDGLSDLREPGASEALPQDIWMEHSCSYVSVLDPKLKLAPSLAHSKPGLKKARSLENIRVENIAASQPSHEMEFISSRIQKLKVME